MGKEKDKEAEVDDLCLAGPSAGLPWVAAQAPLGATSVAIAEGWVVPQVSYTL